MPKLYDLFHPTRTPVKQLRSFFSAAARSVGEWGDLTGVRLDTGVLRVRDGDVKLTSAVPGGGTAVFRGGAILNVDGTTVIVGAYLISGSVRIYRLDPFTYAWNSGVGTELTASTGKYGTTRFSTDAWVRFAVVRDPNRNLSVIVATNGTDPPLVIDITATATERATPHATITPPASSNIQQVLAKFPFGIAVAGASLPTYSASASTHFNIADTGSSPNNHAQITVDSTIATNDYIQLAFSGKDFTLGRQLAFLYDTNFAEFWDNVRIRISEDGFSSSDEEIWDGSDSPNGYQHVIVPFDATGKQVIAFPLDHITSSGKNAITHIRIVYVGNAPTADTTVELYGVFCTGTTPGGSEYALTYHNTGSGAESPPYYSPPANPELVKDLGGTPLDGARIPISELLYYTYGVGYINVTQAMADAGVDRVRFYRRDPGETRFYFEATSVRATWSSGGGVWTVTGTAGALITASHGNYSDTRTFSSYAPGSDHKVLPKASVLGTLGNRLVAGNVNDGSARPGDVWISEAGYPFRFATGLRFLDDDLTTPDPNSPTRHTFGGETVKGFQLLPSGGLQAMLIFTDQWTRQIGGVTSFELSRAAPRFNQGLISTGMVCATKNAVYWVSEQQHLMRWDLSGPPQNLSRLTIHDKLGRATLTNAYLVPWSERIYGTYAPSSTYVKAAVFDEISGRFALDDPFSGAEFGQFFLQGTKLLYFGSEGHVYEHEQYASTADVSVSLATWAIRDEDWSGFTIRRIGAITTPVAGGTLTATAAFYPATGSSNPDYDINLAGSLNLKWAIAEPDLASGDDFTGNYCVLTFAGTLPGGTEIHQLIAELEAVELAPTND